MRTFLRNRAFSIVSTFVLAFGLCISTALPAQANAYPVGSRVEVDALKINVWEPGVVIESSDIGWLVRMDKNKAEYTIPAAWASCCIRPSSLPLPESQKPTTKQPVGILDCPIDQPNKAKAKPKKKFLVKLVRCVYEYRDAPGVNALGTDSKIEIKQWKMGKSRPWDLNRDIGPGSLDTKIWPIKIKFDQFWWHETVMNYSVNRIHIVDCFITTYDEWMCGLGQIIDDSKLESKPRA